MRIEQKEQGLLVHLEGELGHHEALEAMRGLEDVIDSYTPAGLELDFSGVTFMDSSGIGLVMGRYALMQELEGELRLTNLASHIKKVMRLAGLDRLAVFDQDHRRPSVPHPDRRQEQPGAEPAVSEDDRR